MTSDTLTIVDQLSEEEEEEDNFSEEEVISEDDNISEDEVISEDENEDKNNHHATCNLNEYDGLCVKQEDAELMMSMIMKEPIAHCKRRSRKRSFSVNQSPTMILGTYTMNNNTMNYMNNLNMNNTMNTSDANKNSIKNNLHSTPSISNGPKRPRTNSSKSMDDGIIHRKYANTKNKEINKTARETSLLLFKESPIKSGPSGFLFLADKKEDEALFDRIDFCVGGW